MEKLLRQTRAIVKCDYLAPKTEAAVRLFTTHLEVDVPFRDIKKYFIKSISNVFTYATGLSFVYEGIHSNIEITSAEAANKQELKSWVPLIQFYKKRDFVLALHPHRLTEFKEKTEEMKCNRCKYAITNNRFFSCEFCNSLILCNQCNNGNLLASNTRRKSKYHQHLLSKLLLHAETYIQLGQSKCGVCNDSVVYNKDFYGCYDCMEYTECEKCFTEQYRNDTATLDIDALNNVLKYDEDTHEYALAVTNETFCPKNMNLVTPGYMDLTQLFDKPLDNAYFEVTFISFNTQEKVGILLDGDHESQARLFGGCTIGYLNDGIVYNSSYHHPIATITPIRPGDTVGMGILLDSYNLPKLFVTHNGVIQRAMIAVSNEKKYSFGVYFTKHSEVRFKTQMRGPYLFDLNSIPNYRTERKNFLEEVPREIPLLLLSWLAQVPSDLSLLRQVCKTWLAYTNDNFIWRVLFLRKWPLQNPNLPVASWKKFYRSRLERMKPNNNNFLHPIENCYKHDDCPLFWQNLPSGQSKHERYCDKCDRTVYSVHRKQFEAFKADGRRVCLIPQKSVDFNKAVVVIGEEEGNHLKQ